MKKESARIWLEDGCLCVDLKTKTGSCQTGFSKEFSSEGTWSLHSFLYNIPEKQAQTLSLFLKSFCEAVIARQKEEKTAGNKKCPLRAPDASRIRIKPDAEARYQNVLSKTLSELHTQAA